MKNCSKEFRENVLAKLREYQALSAYDKESAHGDADHLLCRVLFNLGYEDIVDEYEKIEKWYA